MAHQQFAQRARTIRDAFRQIAVPDLTSIVGHVDGHDPLDGPHSHRLRYDDAPRQAGRMCVRALSYVRTENSTPACLKCSYGVDRPCAVALSTEDVYVDGDSGSDISHDIRQVISIC